MSTVVLRLCTYLLFSQTLGYPFKYHDSTIVPSTHRSEEINGYFEELRYSDPKIAKKEHQDIVSRAHATFLCPYLEEIPSYLFNNSWWPELNKRRFKSPNNAYYPKIVNLPDTGYFDSRLDSTHTSRMLDDSKPVEQPLSRSRTFQWWENLKKQFEPHHLPSKHTKQDQLLSFFEH